MAETSLPYILSALTFLPLVGAVIVMCLPRPADLPDAHGDHDGASHDASPHAPFDISRSLVCWVAFAFAAITFLLSVALLASFRSGFTSSGYSATGNMQFLEDYLWFRLGTAGIHYRMGIDGISLLLVLLTTLLSMLCVLFSFGVKQRLKEFMVFLLILETAMIGVFCALDLVLFYVFWEAMLIPMYFLIGIFGHERRIYAAIKFFLYTFAGSIFMLVAIVAIYQVTGTFSVLALSNQVAGPGARLAAFGQIHPQAIMWMFAAFAVAFMIKVPMFPFHTWLPDAHVEAPTAGSVILAGVMLKMGTYGFIRFCLPFFPAQAQQTAPIFITLAIIGIVYGSLVAAVQPDAKKLVAYTSVAHLGFVILGVFTFTRVGLMGALLQNINHGISTPMLFFMVGMLYERRHTRLISEFGGLKLIMPMFATMLLIATLASMAVPFFNGFVGEFPVLLGSWISSMSGMWPTAIAATGMIWSAVYMLWWFQRLMLGPVDKPINRNLPDLTFNEWMVLTPLAAIVFWFGLYSPYWSGKMDAAVNGMIPLGAEAIQQDLPVSEAFLPRIIRKGPVRPVVPVRPSAFSGTAGGAGARSRGGRAGTGGGMAGPGRPAGGFGGPARSPGMSGPGGGPGMRPGGAAGFRPGSGPAPGGIGMRPGGGGPGMRPGGSSASGRPGMRQGAMMAVPGMRPGRRAMPPGGAAGAGGRSGAAGKTGAAAPAGPAPASAH